MVIHNINTNCYNIQLTDQFLWLAYMLAIHHLNTIQNVITEIKMKLSYSKFLPDVAGYRIERRNDLFGSTMNTALHVRGKPSLSFSMGSNIPSCTARCLDSSAIIGYGKSFV